MTITYWFVAAVVLYTALAAIVDFRSRRIPNVLTVPAAVLAIVYHAAAPSGLGIAAALAGLALGFLLLLVPWLLGGGGMGDVKLLAALGAWLGPGHVLIAFATSVLVAALLATGVLIHAACTEGVTKTKNTYLAASGNRASSRVSRRSPRPKVRVLPFAVPVAVSTWCLLAWLVVRGGM